MLNNKNIEILKTINIYKNISKASEKLYTAQPNLSRALKNIEKTMGFEIFDRSKTPLNLTKEGEILFEYIDKLENIEKEMYMKINDLSNINNHIKIGTLTFMSQYMIPNILPKFINAYPCLDLTLKKYDSSSFENALLNDEIDLFITNRMIKNKNLKSKFIINDPIYLMYPKLDTNKRKNKLKDFSNEIFYLLKPWKNIRKSVDEIFKNNDFKPSKIKLVSSIMNGVSFVRAKKGVTFIYKTSIDMIDSSDYCDFIEINGQYAQISIIYKDAKFEKIASDLSNIIKDYINSKDN